MCLKSNHFLLTPKVIVSCLLTVVRQSVICVSIYALLSWRGSQNPGSVAAANSGLSPLPHEPADYDRGATIDIPLDGGKVHDLLSFFIQLIFLSLNIWVDLLVSKFRIWRKERRNSKLEKQNWRKGNRYDNMDDGIGMFLEKISNLPEFWIFVELNCIFYSWKKRHDFSHGESTFKHQFL